MTIRPKMEGGDSVPAGSKPIYGLAVTIAQASSEITPNILKQ